MGGGVGELAGAAMSAFGGDEGGGGGGGSQQSSASGYNALPPIARHAYDNLFQAVANVGDKNVNPFPYEFVNRPISPGYRSPFDSDELIKLQASTPDKAIKPVGLIEGFNDYEKNALQALGSPDYSQAAMQQYMNPFQQQVRDATMEQLQRQGDMDRNRLMSNNSLLNSRANSSSLGTQLAQNTENMNRLKSNALANLNYEGYNQGMNLRNQSLQQQLGAGGQIRAQNQAILSASNPQGEYGLLPDYIKATMLTPLFSAFPVSSSTSQGTSWTPAPQQSSPMQRAGGFGMAAFTPNDDGSGSMFSRAFG